MGAAALVRARPSLLNFMIADSSSQLILPVFSGGLGSGPGWASARPPAACCPRINLVARQQPGRGCCLRGSADCPL